MGQRWQRDADFGRQYARADQFDPIAEGARLGLTREAALALWRRVRAGGIDDELGQNPNLPIATSDELYLRARQILGIPTDAQLSHRLLFPLKMNEEFGLHPGYEPLYENGRHVSQYTLPSIAKDLGIGLVSSQNAIAEWRDAFGRHASIEAAVADRIDQLEEKGLHPTPTAVRKWIEAKRAELPGAYIVGTHGSEHFMILKIDANGAISGEDLQDGMTYATIEGIKNRMGTLRFDLAYKISVSP